MPNPGEAGSQGPGLVPGDASLGADHDHEPRRGMEDGPGAVKGTRQETAKQGCFQKALGSDLRDQERSPAHSHWTGYIQGQGFLLKHGLMMRGNVPDRLTCELRASQ